MSTRLGLNSNRSLLTENYFSKIRTEIKSRINEIKSEIDTQAEIIFDSIDKLEIETKNNLESLQENFNEKLDNFRESSITLIRQVSSSSKEEEIDLVWKHFETNFKNKKTLLKYENKFNTVLNQYCFESNHWLPSVNIFGNIIDNRFRIRKKKEEKLDLEIKDGLKINSMCLCGDEIICNESKRTRILKVYDKNFIFLRESKLLVDDSMHRLSPNNLSLASDNIDSVYVCDAADSTIYLLNKELSFIVKQIGSMGNLNGHFVSPNDISFHSELIYVLDTGNCRIQKFHYDGVFHESRQLFSNTESNEILENSKNLSISENVVAVNAPDKGIYIYDATSLELGLIIKQLDVETIEFVRSYLFAHTKQGLLICYQIYASTGTKYHFQTILSRQLKSFKQTSSAMLWFNNSLMISFQKENKVAILNSLT